MSGEITYCDDYEAITGKAKPEAVIETKVINAPAPTPVDPTTIAQVA